MSTRKRLLGNIVSLGAVQVFSYLLPFLSLPYLARTLGTEPLGHVAFALSVAQIMVILTDYGFNLSAPKAIAIHREDRTRITQVWCAVTFLRIVFVCTGVPIIGLGLLLVPAMRQAWDLIIITYLMVIGNVLFPQWLFQGLEQLKRVSVIQIIARLVTFGMMFLLVRGPSDARWAAMLQAAGTLLGGLLALPLTLRVLDTSQLQWPRRDDLTEQLVEGWHVFLSTAAINIYTSCNAFFLGLLATTQAVAHYHVAEKLIRAVQMLFGPIAGAVYPHVSRLAKDDRIAVIQFNRRLIGWFGSGACLVMMLTYILAPWVVHLLFGAEFSPAVPVLRAMAWIPVLIVLSNVLGIQTMLPLGMQSAFSRILIAAAAFDLIVFIILADRYGAEGAAFANVLVEAFVTLCMAIVLHRVRLSPLTTPLRCIAPTAQAITVTPSTFR